MREGALRAVIALLDQLRKPETNVAPQKIRKRLACELESMIELAIKPPADEPVRDQVTGQCVERRT
jgi:hypothetical protein